MITKGDYMRFYGFGNYYLSSLQQGLQAGHAISRLYTRTKPGTEGFDILHEWGNNHDTMVLLNGGNALNLQELYDFFNELKEQGMPLPFQKFHEDDQSLGGALTYVGIIVPPKYYDAAATSRRMHPEEASAFFVENDFKAWEINLVNRMNMYSLAH